MVVLLSFISMIIWSLMPVSLMLNCNKEKKSGKGPATKRTLEQIVTSESLERAANKKPKETEKLDSTQRNNSQKESAKIDQKNEKKATTSEKKTKEKSKKAEAFIPVKTTLTKKEESIAKGAVKNKNDYATFNDIASDWDSQKETKKVEKKAKSEKNEKKPAKSENNEKKGVDPTDTTTKKTQDPSTDNKKEPTEGKPQEDN